MPTFIACAVILTIEFLVAPYPGPRAVWNLLLASMAFWFAQDPEAKWPRVWLVNGVLGLVFGVCYWLEFLGVLSRAT